MDCVSSGEMFCRLTFSCFFYFFIAFSIDLFSTELSGKLFCEFVSSVSFRLYFNDQNFIRKHTGLLVVRRPWWRSVWCLVVLTVTGGDLSGCCPQTVAPAVTTGMSSRPSTVSLLSFIHWKSLNVCRRLTVEEKNRIWPLTSQCFFSLSLINPKWLAVIVCTSVVVCVIWSCWQPLVMFV